MKQSAFIYFILDLFCDHKVTFSCTLILSQLLVFLQVPVYKLSTTVNLIPGLGLEKLELEMWIVFAITHKLQTFWTWA